MEKQNTHGGKRENAGRPVSGKVQLRFWTFKGNKEAIDKFIKEIEMKKLILLLSLVFLISCSKDEIQAPQKNCFQINEKVMKARLQDNNVLTYWFNDLQVSQENYSSYNVGDQYCY